MHRYRADVHRLDDAHDLAPLLAYSIDVFGRLGSDAALVAPTDERSSAEIDDAIAEGFTDALLMPPAAWQQDHLADLAATFAAGDGWDAPYVDVDGLGPTGRPDGPYVLLLRPDATTDDDLRGLTAPVLRKALGTDSCLTITEYLVVQRTLFERYGDHRFDDYAAEASGWMWLPNSTDGTRTAMAYWNGAKGRVEVTACKTGSKNPRKGARRTRVVPAHA